MPASSLSQQQVKCEVCDTLQPPASVCVSCGLPLHLPAGVEPVADAPIERVPDLEMTVADPVDLLDTEMLAGLDPTVAERAGEVAVEPPPDLERVVPEPLEDDLPGFDNLPGPGDQLDIEPTLMQFDRLPPEIEEYPPNCPYCGFQQASGRICNNCGRSRVRVLRSIPTLMPLGDADDDARVRCLSCGAMVRPQELCSDCGAPLPRTES